MGPEVNEPDGATYQAETRRLQIPGGLEGSQVGLVPRRLWRWLIDHGA